MVYDSQYSMKTNKNYFNLLSFLCQSLSHSHQSSLSSLNILARLLDSYFKQLNVLPSSLQSVSEALLVQTLMETQAQQNIEQLYKGEEEDSPFIVEY